jgi:hypothetical protein
MANETRRIIIKKGTSIATIPSSSDHTDGTWLSTDLYIGEFYMNTTNGKIYTRTTTGIEEIIYDVADFEVLANKATSFTVINNTKYPTTQAVENQIDAKLLAENYWLVSSSEIARGYRAQHNSTTVLAENIAVGTLQGTATAVAVSTTSIQNKKTRLRIGVSTPAASGICGYRSTSAFNIVGMGWRMAVAFGVSDSAYNSGARQFYGMTTNTASLGLSSTVTVESLVNIIGIGSDATDTNLQVFYNDGTGTATKIDLGSNFHANRPVGAVETDFIVFELYNPYNSNTVYYKATSLENNVTVQGSITTNLPNNTTPITIQACRTSGASSNACSFDISQLTLNCLS